MPLISHRGAAHLAEANSFDAIQKGDSYNPAYVEVDINRTADGVLVIYHGSVQRFLQGKPTSETYAELKAKFSFLMTLEEFVGKKIKSAYIFDIKMPEDESTTETIALLGKLPRRDFAFTSPHEKALVAMKSAFPESLIFQSQPYHQGPITTLEIARRNHFEGIALNKWWLTPLVYKLCKMHGKKIDTYTVDSRLWIWMAGKFFPGAYITTNRPDIYRKYFPTA
jgi:glycerophosphoryl diester phosphodiesterase